ncbi:fluoride efflux transporter FluC [Cohnella nanjingensis]|uniref:Fluoride-specific ion channel FluC n=1 Tax=Cohnella nanjingensis TaxID=1387779 RepID=A0A7X0RP45_9BACL|nr:CrcB family protein [Cohnella nanjingensis]MBB6671112.1 CrcB family protein [Cohnella nanjingensis]
MTHWQIAGLVGLGGTIGALLRYGASRYAALRKSKPHYATLAVNVCGSLAMGILAGLDWRDDQPATYAFLGTGILGGLTTYSTLNVQKATMRREGRGRQLAGYAAATYLGGWAAFAAGWTIGRAIR